jgi:RNA polymerase sigma factor (sigma-70 family)
MREVDVEMQIGELATATPEVFFASTSKLDANAGDIPRAETLVYFVRELIGLGDTTGAWRIVGTLIRRIDPNMRRFLSRLYGLNSQQKDEIVDDMAALLYAEWLSLEPAHEFWEVRFWVCLKRKLIEIIEKHKRIYANEQPFAAFEPGINADSMDQIEDVYAVDPEQAAIFKSAIECLPDPLRTAFYLYHFVDWPEKSIAKHLGVTDRSVRNYLTRARMRLIEWHKGLV